MNPPLHKPSLSEVLAADKHVSLTVSEGFSIKQFAHRYIVDLFTDSTAFNPVKALAIGEETNNVFGSKRLIVRPLSQVTRRVSNQLCNWPDNILFVSERDVKGWRTT